MKWPQGWREVVLSDVIESAQPGFAQRPGEEDEGTTPQIRTHNVSPDGRITLEGIKHVTVADGDLERYRLLPGDVVFNNTNSEEWVGKTAVFDQHDGVFVYSNHMTRIRVRRELVLPEFLAAFLHYLWSAGYARNRAKRWVSQAAIDGPTLVKFKLPLPPLPEQQRIVEVLQAVDLKPFHDAAEKADLLREMVVGASLRGRISAAWRDANSTEVRGASLVRNELLGIDGEPLDLDWPTVSLLAVCTLNPKLEPDVRPAADAPVTFVPMAAVDERLAAITAPEVRPYAEVQKGYTPFAEGDVLFAKVTPCMENGKAAIASGLIGGIGFGSTEFHVLRPDTRLLMPEYLLHFVRQPQFREQAKAAFVGTGGLQRVPSDFFKRVKLPLPSLPEQRRIVEALKHVAPQSFYRAIEQAKRLQSALITEALSGRLTAAWREQHAQALAEAARERDARLGAPAPRVTVRITEHAPTERRTDLARPRRQAVIEQLSSFQHEVWNTLRFEWRGAVLADDPAAFEEFCTSPQTAWRLEGFAAGREEVRRALEQLAAMGLIRKMSLPRPNPNTGRTEYLAAFRPLLEAEDGSRPEEDTALADAERLARELERRRAPEAR
ncbi:restriction endonuclease subunit S [Tepidimonas sp. HKU79]|uniref:restriction endonuclease subunit S n=1 Tax=Tepidimonas sp. HKU79 TaxID=3414505 RepID=UPI003C79FE55